MREIKFRAIPANKDEDFIDTVLESIAFYEGDEFYDGTFIYGHLNGEYILGKTIEVTDEFYNPSYWIKVDKNTIGQYTGFRDSNKKEIYEGDIVRCYGGEHYQGVYEYDVVAEVGLLTDIMTLMDLSESEYVEIIGNIYENKILEVD